MQAQPGYVDQDREKVPKVAAGIPQSAWLGAGTDFLTEGKQRHHEVI
jgi:hypothetical protein